MASGIPPGLGPAWMKPAISPAVICQWPLPMESGPPGALRQSSDKVPIGNCAIFGCRFIQDALANKAWTDGRVSAKFHLTKKSWELQNQKWLCGNELFEGHPHSHWLSWYNRVPFTREDAFRYARGLAQGEHNVSRPHFDSTVLTLTLHRSTFSNTY